MTKTAKAISFILSSVFIAALVYFDQYTKGLATKYLMGKEDLVLIPDVLVLRYLDGGNRGGAFGILYGQRYFFLVVAVVFMLIMIYLLLRLPATPRYRLLRFFVCMITAGAVGNFIDRLLNGFVVDFIYIIYINFPIFNVADIYVTVSAFALAILILFVYREDELNMKKANDPRLHLHSSMVPDDDK